MLEGGVGYEDGCLEGLVERGSVEMGRGLGSVL